MLQLILFTVFVFITGLVWGCALEQAVIKYRMKKGNVPGFIKKLMGGDAYPKAPGSGPGIEVKSQVK